ncbi:MAG: NAD(P)-binding protein [Lachnospiraceae bacterium]|nr:NAD(P)-binding protein [Lachnospiraceae bacterium]
MKYLIIGAGPSGLSFAHRLIEQGENDFLIIEQEKEAGGLCRSVSEDGSPLDTGGGHFLDVKNRKVVDFLFKFMPESEWDVYERDSRIFVNDTLINSPIEANIWQMELKDQVEYLKAIAIAGCNLGTPMPERFVDWIYWKLGKKIAEDYMIPYNKKMFGEDLDSLGTYWLNKLPNVSFDETLISCLERKAYGSQPAHARFYYPKRHGYGEVWLRMGEALKDKLCLNEKAEILDCEKRTVNGTYSADRIINTAPWKSFKELKGVSGEMIKVIEGLRFSSIVVDYRAQDFDNEAHWVYYPDPRLSYHRILARQNFCPGAKGYWTETNLTRFNAEATKSTCYFINEYAYPLNTIGKNEGMDKLLSFMKERGIYGLGRWGEWQHYNSDVVVDRAIELADAMVLKG